MTIEGKELAIKTLDKAQNRCPDFFDMYIYNGQYFDAPRAVLPCHERYLELTFLFFHCGI